MREIKVSVVIAIYNTEKYLRQTLESIQNQTLRDIEVICVDDGSKDNSVSIIQEFVDKDDRFILMKQREPSDGAALARNLGMSVAKGKYLSILDSDDFFEPNMLECAYIRAEDDGSDIVIFDGYGFDERDQKIKDVGYILRSESLLKEKKVFKPSDNSINLFQMTLGAAWNCLVRSDFAKREGLKFQSFFHADDLGFVYLGFACAKQISVIDTKYVYYRINNSQSQAANIVKQPEAAYLALLQLQSELQKRGLFNIYKVTFAKLSMIYIAFYLDGLTDGDAFDKLYLELQSTYMEKLGVYDVSDEDYNNKYYAALTHAIKELSPTEYFIHKMRGLPPFEFKPKWWGDVCNKSIVLYGAGNVGKDIFCDILRNNRCSIVAWADRNFERIGYPVVSPKYIPSCDYDLVLVSVAEKDLYARIKTDLVGIGVNENHIIWIGEENE